METSDYFWRNYINILQRKQQFSSITSEPMTYKIFMMGNNVIIDNNVEF